MLVPWCVGRSKATDGVTNHLQTCLLVYKTVTISLAIKGQCIDIKAVQVLINIQQCNITVTFYVSYNMCLAPLRDCYSMNDSIASKETFPC